MSSLSPFRKTSQKDGQRLQPLSGMVFGLTVVFFVAACDGVSLTSPEAETAAAPAPAPASAEDPKSPATEKNKEPKEKAPAAAEVSAEAESVLRLFAEASVGLDSELMKKIPDFIRAADKAASSSSEGPARVVFIAREVVKKIGEQTGQLDMAGGVAFVVEAASAALSEKMVQTPEAVSGEVEKVLAEVALFQESKNLQSDDLSSFSEQLTVAVLPHVEASEAMNLVAGALLKGTAPRAEDTSAFEAALAEVVEGLGEAVLGETGEPPEDALWNSVQSKTNTLLEQLAQENPEKVSAGLKSDDVIASIKADLASAVVESENGSNSVDESDSSTSNDDSSASNDDNSSGGEPPTPTYSIGGSVTGLSGSLVLQNNAGNDLNLSTDGSFEFSEELDAGSSYAVTIVSSPSGQTCTLSGASGTSLAADVANVSVSCVNKTYSISGSLSGLSGTVVLQNNAGDDLNLNSNGAFSFPVEVLHDAPYAVTVLTQPSGMNCVVSSGSGAATTADVTDVSVSCSALSYPLTATVSGSSGAVVLQNNGGDDLSFPTAGTRSFSAQMSHGSAYTISVSSPPAGQVCTISNGTSAGITAAVTNIAVSCTNVTIGAFYTTHGANWNDYVGVAKGTLDKSAEAACDPDSQTQLNSKCTNGGLHRAVAVPTQSDCTGLTATDSLGVFSWTCVNTAGSVEMVSTDFVDTTKGLRDLVDWAVSPIAWKPMSVTVNLNASNLFTTPAGNLYANSVITINTSGDLTTEGAVYVVTDNATGLSFKTEANKVSLLTEPGETMQTDGSNDFIWHGTTGFDFLWYEFSVDIQNTDYSGIWTRGSDNLVIRNSYITNYVTDGYYMNDSHSFLAVNSVSDGGTDNLATGMYVTDSLGELQSCSFFNSNDDGLHVDAGSTLFSNGLYARGNYNGVDHRGVGTFHNTRLESSTVAGIWAQGVANQTKMYNTIAVNNSTGIEVDSVGMVMNGVRAYGNDLGIYVVSGADDVVITQFAAVGNNNRGVEGAANNLILMAGIVQSTDEGVYDAGTNTTMYAVASFDNSSFNFGANNGNGTLYGDVISIGSPTAFTWWSSTGFSFSGNLNIAASSTLCHPQGTEANHTAINWSGYDCAPANAGDWTTSSDTSISGAFTGVVTDDSSNSSDFSSGNVAANTISDWSRFDNNYRMIIVDRSETSPDQSSTFGACNGTELCSVYDFTLAGASPFYGQLDSPLLHEDDSYAVTRSGKSFILGALESMDPSDTGNKNGLCEQNETCIMAPNIGMYQWDDTLPLVTLGTFNYSTNWTGITIKKHESGGGG